MHKRVLPLIGTIFLILGLVSGLVAAGFAVRRHRVASNSVPVVATIVDITNFRDNIDGDTSRVYIEYLAEGQLINTRLGWSSSNMRVGGNVRLLVDRNDPTRFVSAGFVGWLGVFIPGVLAAVWLLVAAILLLVHRGIGARRRWLFDFGIPVWATVLGYDENWRVVVNGRPAEVIVAEYENMRFTSGPLDNNDLMRIGTHVKVLFDPNDANRYAFDIHNESYLMPAEPAPAESSDRSN